MGSGSRTWDQGTYGMNLSCGQTSPGELLRGIAHWVLQATVSEVMYRTVDRDSPISYPSASAPGTSPSASQPGDPSEHESLPVVLAYLGVAEGNQNSLI